MDVVEPALRVVHAGEYSQISFEQDDSVCRMDAHRFSSGLQLGITRCSYRPKFAFRVEQPVISLELTVSRGDPLEGSTPDGNEHIRGGSFLHIGRAARCHPLVLRAPAGATLHCASLILSPERLRAWMGQEALPTSIEEVLSGAGEWVSTSASLTPSLARALDEICAGETHPSRAHHLWREARAMSLTALVVDELVEIAPRPLHQHDLEKLEKLRRSLITRLGAHHSMSSLAKEAAMSETRLKVAFRTAYGTPIFSWLRVARLEEAARLLRQNHHDVTKIATLVGYANPSKFAAAFRREFGVSPSSTLPRRSLG